MLAEVNGCKGHSRSNGALSSASKKEPASFLLDRKHAGQHRSACRMGCSVWRRQGLGGHASARRDVILGGPGRCAQSLKAEGKLMTADSFCTKSGISVGANSIEACIWKRVGEFRRAHPSALASRPAPAKTRGRTRPCEREQDMATLLASRKRGIRAPRSTPAKKSIWWTGCRDAWADVVTRAKRNHTQLTLDR